MHSTQNLHDLCMIIVWESIHIVLKSLILYTSFFFMKLLKNYIAFFKFELFSFYNLKKYVSKILIKSNDKATSL